MDRQHFETDGREAIRSTIQPPAKEQRPFRDEQGAGQAPHQVAKNDRLRLEKHSASHGETENRGLPLARSQEIQTPKGHSRYIAKRSGRLEELFRLSPTL